MAPKIETLEKHHDRSLFDCGCPHLNKFLQNYARQARGRQESSTLVAVDQKRVIGFATLVCSVLSNGENERPVLRLGRFGVDKAYARNGVGRALMARVFEAVMTVADIGGCVGVVVDAKLCSKADAYYDRWGFKPLPTGSTPPGTMTMFLRYEAIAKARSQLSA